MSLAHFGQNSHYNSATDAGKDIGFIFLLADIVLNFVAMGPSNFFSSLRCAADCVFVISFVVVLALEPYGFFRSSLQIAITVRWIEQLSELGRIYRGSALSLLLNVVKMSLLHLQNM
jgi:hypothetical protein